MQPGVAALSETRLVSHPDTTALAVLLNLSMQTVHMCGLWCIKENVCLLAAQSETWLVSP